MIENMEKVVKYVDELNYKMAQNALELKDSDAYFEMTVETDGSGCCWVNWLDFQLWNSDMEGYGNFKNDIKNEMKNIYRFINHLKFLKDKK